MKLNAAISTTTPTLIQAINGEKRNLLKIRCFSFSKNKSAETVPKLQNVLYKGLRLVEGKRKYIEYYYLIPQDLPRELWRREDISSSGKLKTWGRWRTFGEDINRNKDPENPAQLLGIVRDALNGKNGAVPFSPYRYMMEEWSRLVAAEKAQAVIQAAKQPVVTLANAVEKFLKIYAGSPSFQSHQVIKVLLMDWFEDRFDEDIERLTFNDLDDMLVEYNAEREWTKSTYNDKVKKLKTLFKSLRKKNLIKEDISASLVLKTKVVKTKHTPFTDEMLEKVKKLLINHAIQPMGQMVNNFFEVIYYTCTRPDKETRQLKCGDIRWKDNTIVIESARAKGGAGGTIPMPKELKTLLLKMGVDKAAPEDYIFGEEFKPGPVPFRKAKISEFFRKEVREPSNMSEDYTPYGMKHTRIIRLYIAGASIREIQHLCRHASPSQTEDYLRDLGLLVSHETSKKTRAY